MALGFRYRDPWGVQDALHRCMERYCLPRPRLGFRTENAHRKRLPIERNARANTATRCVGQIEVKHEMEWQRHGLKTYEPRTGMYDMGKRINL